jgi:hypothetical protein
VGPGSQISDFATSQALEPARPHGQNKGLRFFFAFLKISVNVFVGVEGSDQHAEPLAVGQP